MKDNRTIISIDVETDGPCPGLNSMIQLGAVAVTLDGVEAGNFCMSLEPLLDRGAKTDPDTMDWWLKSRSRERVLRQIQQNARPPRDVIYSFHKWVSRFHLPTPLCAPAAFDWPFVRYYLHRFIPDERSSYWMRCMDLRSYWDAFSGKGYSGNVKKGITSLTGFRPKTKHTHVAVEDAREQAELFIALHQWGTETKTNFTS